VRNPFGKPFDKNGADTEFPGEVVYRTVPFAEFSFNFLNDFTEVLIIGKGLGSLSLFSNTIDVLRIPHSAEKESMNLSDGLSQWMKDHPNIRIQRWG
jgi:hypothetical protein